jgi:AcrR family transcriptional regulator
MARTRGDIDARIVQAARKRFLTEGVDGASLRAIAKDAGTNVGMIYYYFPTKDDLFLGVIEDVYAGLLDDLGVAMREETQVEARLRRLYHRVASMSEIEFDVIRIVVREALVSSERLAKVFQRFTTGHVPMILSMVQQGMQDGTFDARRPLAAIVAALATTAIFPQLMRRRIASQLPAIDGLVPEPTALADALLDILLHGASR